MEIAKRPASTSWCSASLSSRIRPSPLTICTASPAPAEPSRFDPQQCNRKRRSVGTTVLQAGITDPSVLTVAIRAEAENSLSGGESDDNGMCIGLGIAVAVLFVIGVTAVMMAAFVG
ncbi:uncharacterized protein si:ch211-229d2.5 [Micropterus salmoides]|uniref:uncharacterized protein si:ch211-229d2.5 n=1 Tax=Micropterus salmoides TaxID=27706 RepID=UPI0018EDDDB3|nr:uncharacterized protein si:ch211-229d2.5 [Micropterus salmoides]